MPNNNTLRHTFFDTENDKSWAYSITISTKKNKGRTKKLKSSYISDVIACNRCYTACQIIIEIKIKIEIPSPFSLKFCMIKSL